MKCEGITFFSFFYVSLGKSVYKLEDLFWGIWDSTSGDPTPRKRAMKFSYRASGIPASYLKHRASWPPFIILNGSSVCQETLCWANALGRRLLYTRFKLLFAWLTASFQSPWTTVIATCETTRMCRWRDSSVEWRSTWKTCNLGIHHNMVSRSYRYQFRPISVS